jgi:hypothetical protein
MLAGSVSVLILPLSERIKAIPLPSPSRILSKRYSAVAKGATDHQLHRKFRDCGAGLIMVL